MGDSVENHRQQAARSARGDVARATGHRYQHLERELDTLSLPAIRDLQRLLRNLQEAAQSEKNKRRRGQFWG